MKAQILKIAGVKSEKEFYKKYPSEEAFMKVHGKEFKKAQMGAAINSGPSGFKPISYQAQYDDVDKMLTGSTEAERQAELAKQQAAAPKEDGGGGGGFDIGGLMKLAGGAMGGGEGMGDMGGAAAGASSAAAARYGRDIPRAQTGKEFPTKDFNNGAPSIDIKGKSILESSYNKNVPSDVAAGAAGAANQPQENTWSKVGGALGKYAGPVGDVISGIGELKKEKEMRKSAEQARDVSAISLKAAESIDVDARRQQSENMAKQREAQMPVNTGEEFFPIYGVGTNVLARNGMILQGGGEIQNTFAPNDIYMDSGYEPLNDSNIKQYYHGGRLYRMQTGGEAAAGGGTPWGMISQKATGIGQELMGGQNAGGKIGGTIGSTAGTLIGGPIGGAIGGFVGGLAGNALDTNAKKMKKAQDATLRNMQGMANVNMAKGIQAQNQSYMKDGGWVSHDWTPQVIASFGGLNEQEVYDYAHEGMDTLRAGGHLREYTPPSDRAMEIYEDGGEVQSYGLGGQLKTHWGGRAETISHNPYLPGSGETVTFRGQSHTESDGNGKTGIGITYGDNPVEVERGEPMFEMQSGGEVDPETGEPQNTGVVFGNMQVNKNVAKQFKDPELMAIANKYHGKKFKNIGLTLSKDESKQNKIIDKNINELQALKIQTPFDKLKLSALKMSIEGADTKLKQLANTKIILANYQNAINDAKEEISEGVGKNISAEDLSRGYVKLDKDPVTKNAKWGNTISKLQTGDNVKDYENEAQAIADGYTTRDEKGNLIKKVKKTTTKKTEKKSANAMDNIPKQSVDKSTGLAGGLTKEKFEQFKKRFPDYPGIDKLDPKNPKSLNDFKTWANNKAKEMGSTARIMDDPITDKNPKGLPIFGNQYFSFNIDKDEEVDPIEEEEILRARVKQPSKGTSTFEEEEEGYEIPWWAKVTNSLVPLIRPSDQEGFDTAQLYPEMFAMATNELEPVPAQFYRPDLNIPYDISFQDQLNANQADYKSAQRMMGYNPAAQANLNAQKYQANQSVLANQFRANQEMKDRVYSGNRDTLNAAKMANLQIGANQFDKQALARSNTKATTQAALDSIADKYAKNKLENRTLSIYENMYNYRFGKNGRAKNYNPLQFFDTDFGGGKGGDSVPPGYKIVGYDKNRNPTLKRITEEDDDDYDYEDLEAVGKTPGIGDNKKNGGPIKKNYKNSSIVRAYKNI